MEFRFSKWHGLGNDFIIVNCLEEKIADYSQMAVKVCDRHVGIGADGLVLILPSNTADFTMRIFNSDGSEAEMCGNVTRCVARYVYEYGLTEKTEINLETGAGIIRPKLIFTNGIPDTVCVDMGEPRLRRGQIPMKGNPDEQAVNTPLEIAGHTYYVTCVSMGNPHCIIFVDNVNQMDLPSIGPLIENHPLFPNKTNVEFVQVVNKQSVCMRVWERGAGITMACGTGACATLVAAVLNGKTDRQAIIHLDGGDLSIEWGADKHVYMTGPAIEVFRGAYL